ncbi:MAG: response regulator [Lachnospiraceae bacterium]|nr:response regulator [Lachnospiraceae bacterium]
MSTVSIFHMTLEIWGAIFCAIATITVFNGSKVNASLSHRTAAITLATMVLMISDCLAWAYRGVPTTAGMIVCRAGNFMNFFSNYLLIYLFYTYVRAVLAEKKVQVLPAIEWIFRVLLIISEVGLIINLFTGHLYYFTEYNVYTRGPLFIISQLPGFIGLLLAAYILIHYHRALSNVELLAMATYLILPLIALPLQVAFYGVSLQNMATAVSVALLFATTMSSQSRRLLEAMNEAEQANRAKDDFLASMSHEIRTPINGILGMNEMILRESEDDRITEYANGIANSGSTLLSLVNEILDFAKISSGKLILLPTEYELRNVVDSLVRMFYPRICSKELKLNLRVFPGTPNFLLGDEARVRQVIANLMSNAIKFTQEGTITLDVNYEKGPGRRVNLLISVEDTGIGIRPEDLPKLYRTFSRLEDSTKGGSEGRGLGLAVSQRLVQIMNGNIEVRSEYGKGTKFVVTIPQQLEKDGRIGEVKLEENELLASGTKVYKEDFRAPEAKVLVVDDNNMNLRVADLLLQKTCVQIKLCTGGREAVDLMRKEKYDLVLLDHMMPEMDGVEALRVMKDENLVDGVPVIALTANAIEGARQMYLNYGFDDYLAKPIVGKALEECLQKWLPKDKVQLSNGAEE